MDKNLPESWEAITFGQVVKSRMGKTILSKNLKAEGLPVFSAATENQVWGYTDDESLVFRRGTIVISARGTIGAAKIPRFDRFISTQTTIAATPLIGLDSRYLSFQLACVDWTNYTSTTAIPMLTISALSTLPVVVAPLNEQRRIVEKIETLFARIDQGEAALRQVQTLLARYRQSILKAAVTGQLTADWRAENAHRLEPGQDLLQRILQTRRETWQGRGKYKEPTAPDTTNLPELPDGWVWASIGQISSVLGGLTKNSKRQGYALRKAMLRVANVYQNRLELDDIHETGVTKAECKRVLLEDRDILVVEGNGSKDQIGRMALWRNEIPGAVHQNHLIKIRLLDKRLAMFALWWFQSPTGRQVIEQVASSTSGLYTLSISKIEALVMPIPSLEEVDQINQTLAQTSREEEIITRACQTELTRSTALRQSILKQAFAGRLVPQDPNDEPASQLLARIRDAGEQTSKQGKTRRKAKA